MIGRDDGTLNEFAFSDQQGDRYADTVCTLSTVSIRCLVLVAAMRDEVWLMDT